MKHKPGQPNENKEPLKNIIDLDAVSRKPDDPRLKGVIEAVDQLKQKKGPLLPPIADLRPLNPEN